MSIVEKYTAECSAAGFEYIGKSSRVGYSVVKCMVCGAVDEFQQGNIRGGRVRCKDCQISKYQQASKDGWTFINHYCENHRSYVNIQHRCSDAIVKVEVGAYLNGSYDCPHCMHSHYSDQSYFYVIQVEDIIKLGISNRPAHRYTQYGLPEGANVIEHLRIPLENKRDALVVESYAKQLAKEYKIQPDIAKQVFTQSGYNECYSLESLDLLLTI